MFGKVMAFLLSEEGFRDPVFDITLTPGATIIGLGHEQDLPVVYAFIDDKKEKTDKRRFSLILANQVIHAISLTYIDKFHHNHDEWFLFEIFNQDVGSRLDKGIMEQLEELDDDTDSS